MWFAVSSLAILVIASQAESRSHSIKRSPGQEETTVDIRKAFELLYEHVGQTYQQQKKIDGFLIFPENVLELFYVMYDGAEEGSRTRSELENFILKWKGTLEVEGKNLIRNSQQNLHERSQMRLFIQHGYKFLSEYMNRVKSRYQLDNQTVDFNTDAGYSPAIYDVNLFVKQITNELITNVFPAEYSTRTTKYFPVNAKYHGGEWKYPFVGQANQWSGRVKKNVGTGAGLENNANAYVHNDRKICYVGIPLKEKKQYMYFVQYKDGDIVGDFASGKLASEEIKMYTRNSLNNYHKVNYVVPAINMTSEAHSHGEHIMTKDGLFAMFDKNSSKLNRIIYGKNLYVQDVYYKWHLDVNVNGIEAAYSIFYDLASVEEKSYHDSGVYSQVMIQKMQSWNNEVRDNVEESQYVIDGSRPFLYYLYQEENDAVIGEGTISFMGFCKSSMCGSSSQLS